MSMPIQRQSESFGYFDDGPRFARDRSSTDLPSGLAHLINTSGPRITGGLLNTRQAAKEFNWQAHDDEFYPEVEGYSSPGARVLQKRLRDSQGNRPEPEPVDWDSIAPPKPKPRHTRQAAGGWGLNRGGYGDGPRDHGGHGPDGGPSVPDWYYDEENEDNGDPPDPPGTPREDPWGHHAGSRLAGDLVQGPLERGWENMDQRPGAEDMYRLKYMNDPRQHGGPEGAEWSQDYHDAEQAWLDSYRAEHPAPEDDFADGYDDEDGYRMGSRRPFDRTAAHCPECDKPCDVDIEGHGYEEQYQEFPVSDCCGAELEDDGPDPDLAYDSWKDDQILGNDWREGSMRPFDRAAGFAGPGSIVPSDQCTYERYPGGFSRCSLPVGHEGNHHPGGKEYQPPSREELMEDLRRRNLAQKQHTGACQECGGDVLPRGGAWEHVDGPSDHLADPDEDDYDNDEYGEGLDPARGMDAYKQHREGRRWYGQYDDLPPLPEDFNIPDSPEGQPDRSPGWLHRQFVSPHKGVWDIPEHELDDRWNKVYDTLGFDPKTRQEWEAGRNTGNPSDKWDGGLDGIFGGGVKDYLTRAPMSKEEYARHREHSQNRAKEMVDGLWGAMFPPEEEEGRKAVQGMDTVNRLMDNGWGPEHIKYDEDDQPYAHYQHPSGWNVTDHGGMYKEIGHDATPGEAHDAINVSRNVDGQNYNAPFGPADAHNHIEEQLHGDPEETGGTFQYLTQNHPAIRRYKPRQARLAQMSYEDTMKYIDDALATGEPEDRSDYSTDYYDDGFDDDYLSPYPGSEPGDPHPGTLPRPGGHSRENDNDGLDDDYQDDDDDEFGPGKPWVDRRDKEHAEFENALEQHMKKGRRVALAPQDPAMAPQVPVGGGFQAGHRVGLDWRDSTVPGTVIANDGQVHIRWDDGQYTSEEPTEVRLL